MVPGRNLRSYDVSDAGLLGAWTKSHPFLGLPGSVWVQVPLPTDFQIMKLASIESISEIVPHPNADRLELAKVLGWQVIIRKGEFAPGDKAVLVVIDTILPVAPWSEFLRKGDKPIRLNTIKLRGEYSQGLLLPLTVLPECVRGWQVGADVGAELGVKKYEKELPASLSGQVKCNFPLHLAPRTDEDNGLSNPHLVEAVLRHPVLLTLKLDGSSCTVTVRNGEIEHVCSRNLSLEKADNNAFWVAARSLKLLSGDYVIQGELMGPGIQGNQLKLTKPTLYVYQVRLLPGGEWITSPEALRAFVSGCEYVWEVPAPNPVTLGSLQSVADALALPGGAPAEGIVVRPRTAYVGGSGRPLSFKIINRNYKD